MYNFDKQINRRNTGSLKWNVKDSELPMWVADMDFEAAPEIIQAIKNRVEHGIFGYSIVPDELYQAYQNWCKKRHNLFIEKEQLIFATGVIPVISSLVRKLTTAAENVLIMTPVYNIFFNSILNNGRNVIESPLVYKDGNYSIDFNDLESKLSDPQTTLMVLCNPHNPIGKIWDKETLMRIGNLCKTHHVTVISDEIHCDLTAPGMNYVPFLSVSEECKNNSITCIAPTKTFNLAGLQSAAVVVPDANLRHKVDRALNTDELTELNAIAIVATIAALEHGGDWLDECRQYIQGNKETVVDYLNNHLSNISVVSTDASYLLWLDCRKVCSNSNELANHIRKTTGLYLIEGSRYGKNGEGFLRMNVACTKETLRDGLEKLKRALNHTH